MAALVFFQGYGLSQAALSAVASQEDVIAGTQGCITCHQESSIGFVSGHQFGADGCITCHGGQAEAATESEAHADMFAFPGNLSNAEVACGSCHQEHVTAVSGSSMASGEGLVETTRRLFGDVGGSHNLSSLGHSPADTLLRKLCASCHLQEEKELHSLNPVTDRGGGCLACHINRYVAGQHPALSAAVEGSRCFGCHSRSGRISMNYAGLGEVDESAVHNGDAVGLGRLEDQRLVQRLANDRHHRAGMTCIDCHTSRDTMGMDNPQHSPDIGCGDCHDREGDRINLTAWPAQFKSQLKRIPFELTPGQQFLVTNKLGTPLWHIEVGEDQSTLYPKLGGKPLVIPMRSEKSHGDAQQHARLRCDACHSQWAPQCYGCHTSYQPDGRQWDHVEQSETEGRWSERRWSVRNGLPPLGVTADNRIAPFVPGMILSVDHPQLAEPLFRRLFAPLAPHTSGPARSCESCHRSSTALGLGSGQLEQEDGHWSFLPEVKLLHDGLPADAWTDLAGNRGGDSLVPGARSFDGHEIERILGADVGARETTASQER